VRFADPSLFRFGRWRENLLWMKQIAALDAPQAFVIETSEESPSKKS
jgi:hypothetical protein